MRIKRNAYPAMITHFERIFRIEVVLEFDAEDIVRELGPQEPETVERVREEVEKI